MGIENKYIIEANRINTECDIEKIIDLLIESEKLKEIEERVKKGRKFIYEMQTCIVADARINEHLDYLKQILGG